MFCTIYVLSVFSCATTTKGDMEEHINIVDFESKLIRLQDVFGQMDSLPLFSRAEWSLGAVKSVCIDKSTLFLLDNTNAIFAFDLSTGIVKIEFRMWGMDTMNI